MAMIARNRIINDMPPSFPRPTPNVHEHCHDAGWLNSVACLVTATMAMSVMLMPGCGSHQGVSAAMGALADESKTQAYWQEIPSSAFKFEMLPIPGDAEKGIEPFHMSRMELTWESFDCFIYRLDEQTGVAANGADAITRPSKPYLPPDRGFGHEGFAAISMSHQNAAAFCEWLSKKSGRKYRLPTQLEWEHACRAGSTTSYSFGEDSKALSDHAWFKNNAENVPHAVGTKKPNAWGLHDMHGNVAEWCVTAEGKPIVCGGSYRDKAEDVESGDSQSPQPAWNASDPQIPKSKWWLADAPFIGFRVVCEVDRTPVSQPAARE